MSELIPINSQEDQAIISLIEARRGRSQMAFAGLSLDELRKLRRQDYLDAVNANAVQFLALAIRRFGVPQEGQARYVWSGSIGDCVISANYFLNGAVTVAVDSVVVVDNTRAGEEKFIAGPWLASVVKFYKHKEIERESAAIVAENKERTELILDLSSQL